MHKSRKNGESKKTKERRSYEPDFKAEILKMLISGKKVNEIFVHISSLLKILGYSIRIEPMEFCVGCQKADAVEKALVFFASSRPAKIVPSIT